MQDLGYKTVDCCSADFVILNMTGFFASHCSLIILLKSHQWDTILTLLKFITKMKCL